MKRKNMAHPMWQRNTRLGQLLYLITMAIALVLAVLLNSFRGPSSISANIIDQDNMVSSVSATSASDCKDSMKTVIHQDPAKQAVTKLRGPAYATMWFNNPAVPRDAAWNIANSKNPEWGQKEVKVKIPWGVEVDAYWAGGTFVTYSRNADCQARMNQEFKADSRPEKSLDTMLQWGLISYWHIGKK
jgi:hypothetical protein